MQISSAVAIGTLASRSDVDVSVARLVSHRTGKMEIRHDHHFPNSGSGPPHAGPKIGSAKPSVGCCRPSAAKTLHVPTGCTGQAAHALTPVSNGGGLSMGCLEGRFPEWTWGGKRQASTGLRVGLLGPAQSLGVQVLGGASEDSSGRRRPPREHGLQSATPWAS